MYDMHRILYTRAQRTLLLLMLLGLVLTGGMDSLIPVVYAQVDASQQTTIKEAVISAITHLKGAPPAHGALVDVKRTSADQQWAFGTIVLLTPKQEHPADATDAQLHDEIPEGRLWIAHFTPTGWQAAIDYTPTFNQWLQEAPSPVISSKERAILGAANPNGASGIPAMAANATSPPDTLFALPWAPGQRWKLSGGPHKWNRDSPPWSALDFAPGEGDGRVLAARDGLIYRPCGNTTYVLIKHADGWQTDYYHLTNIPYYQEGTWIESGRYLGNTSTAVECGGSASGAHVHFNIRYQGQHVAWDGRRIGGWTIIPGDQPYAGCAERNGEQVCAGGLMTNYDIPSTAYDSADAGVVYSGIWNHQVNVGNTYGNTISSSTSAGSTVRFSFTGRRVSLLYSLIPNGGNSDISINGQYYETINHRAAETRRQVIKTWELGYGSYTIEVRAKGNGPADVDAFVVNLATVSPGSYDNTYSQWRYIGSWQPATNVGDAYQGTLHWSATPGAAARFTFTGDRIMYVYSKTPYRGTAAITIDGVDKGYIDLYAPNVMRQQSTTFANLGPGVHVLHITVTGQQAPEASAVGVDVDRVVIPSDQIFVPVATSGQQSE
jgi:LasA protease